MSASSENSAIFMTDTPAQIKTKINRHAFSGGGETVEVHRERGANLAVDIPFQYLRFFMESDEELNRIAGEYSAGRMLTGEVKAVCINILQEFVGEFQKRRAAVDDEIVKNFMSIPPSAKEVALLAEIAELKAKLQQ